jgi:hypothetical protein
VVKGLVLRLHRLPAIRTRFGLGEQLTDDLFREGAVVATIGKAGSPIEYLDAPEFQAYWDADARAMAEAVKRIGKVE